LSDFEPTVSTFALTAFQSGVGAVGSGLGAVVDAGKVIALHIAFARCMCSLQLLQSGVSSVGDKTGSFALPSMSSLPGMGKSLSLEEIIVISPFFAAAFSPLILPTG
jgi:hypothetical protein